MDEINKSKSRKTIWFEHIRIASINAILFSNDIFNTFFEYNNKKNKNVLQSNNNNRSFSVDKNRES